MPTIEEFLDDAKRRMDKSIETTRTEFNSVRTGRSASPTPGRSGRRSAWCSASTCKAACTS